MPPRLPPIKHAIGVGYSGRVFSYEDQTILVRQDLFQPSGAYNLVEKPIGMFRHLQNEGDVRNGGDPYMSSVVWAAR